MSDPAGRIDVRNPRTGEVDYHIEPPTKVSFERAIAALRSAQPGWLGLGVDGRVAVLKRFSSALTAHRDDLVAALETDTGRRGETGLEVQAMLGALERWCDRAPALLEPPAPTTTSMGHIDAEPDPVCYTLAGVISPWNFPLLLSFVDTVPALLAGCAIALKPSEVTPRFVDPLQAAIDEVPELAAVLGIFRGDGRLGAAVVDAADVVCFTGSVATGRRVAEAAAKNLIPANLELGGKDPAIVTAACDPVRAAAAINWGGLANAGQSCLSIERVYVEAGVHDAFVEALVGYTAALRLNIDDIADGEVGPIISRDQIEIVRRHLADAEARGARVACGGRLVTRGGTWCEPTVLTNVDHTMLVMTEESFAPLLPVMAVDSVDEAIRLANDTPYGLSAAVFCDDADEARRIAGRLEAGAISLNDAALTALIHEGEKQAFKSSGLGGSRMGDASIRRFLKSRVLLNNTALAWDPWWYASPRDGT